MVWRPILAKITTLTEIREKWTLYDLLDANEALDAKQDAEEYAMRKSKEKSRG